MKAKEGESCELCMLEENAKTKRKDNEQNVNVRDELQSGTKRKGNALCKG